MESNKLVWETLTAEGEVYTPRTGHTVAVHKNSLYVFAGTDDLFRQNDMYHYNASDLKWSKVSMTGEMPPPRSGGQSITYKDFIYVFGGYAKKVGEYYNDLYKFDINGKNWLRVSTKGTLNPRVDHAFAVFNDSAYVFGGTDGKRKLRDLQELSLERAEWRQVPYKDIWPSARFGHSYVSYQDSLYLFGGWDGTNTLNDFWRYTPSLQAWKQISARTAIASRYRHIAVTCDNAMYIFGGVDKDQERFGDLLEYDFHESSWKRIIPANEGPSARTFHRAGVINKHLYIVGGFDGTRLNDLHKINLENVVPINEFSCNTLATSTVLTPETSNPQEFIDFTKSYSELKALMKKAGGEIRFQKLPVDRWFAFIPKTENYSARTGHTAALVDKKIFLFAGVDAGGAVSNDFSVFDLQLENWSKVKSEGKVPSARSGCKCIQDRHLIYFFGGYTTKTKSANIKEYFHDMHCFDTTNNNWREIIYNIKSSQMPTKRTDHSLVFYNDSLYVFGGKGAKEEIFRDFFRFNLNSRIWTEIKGERAILQPSFGHSATVYQDSMYVFGGWDGTVCLDDFYQYSFNTNIWYNLKRSSGEKPSPRYRHDALEYMGSLYIFGGVNAGQIRFNDFYQYNFDLRQWLCIKVSGCMPSPRTFHKIINYENIIFLLGGFDGERKNDMHIISVEQTITKPLSRKFLEFEEPTEVKPQLSVSVEPPSQHLIKMLNEQVLELSQKLQKEEERHLCKICFTREIDALILECCHFVSCYSCSSSLKHCPICREEIVKIVQTYKS